ncbi:hypothetical protein MTO96_005025 [Rhipicephalus appendiculatus]
MAHAHGGNLVNSLVSLARCRLPGQPGLPAAHTHKATACSAAARLGVLGVSDVGEVGAGQVLSAAEDARQALALPPPPPLSVGHGGLSVLLAMQRLAFPPR